MGLAHMKVSSSGQLLVSLALGSCVAVALYDNQKSIGALAHILLPESPTAKPENAVKYANTAIPYMIKKMVRLGARRGRIVAKIVGGAFMFIGSENSRVGQRNVSVVKDVLFKERIKIVSEDTGGDYARSVFFDTKNGKIVVKSYAKGQKEI